VTLANHNSDRLLASLKGNATSKWIFSVQGSEWMKIMIVHIYNFFCAKQLY